MKYISVCSGIEAATVAWHPLGFEPLCFSEFDKFPSQVLAHHYPNVTNHGDMTKFMEWPDYEPDILVGGTPCQSFSVAGLRKGLDDERGNLMLTYLEIAGRFRPKWVVWENVPGCLSTNGGRDFGSLLGGLAKLGYGFAYRILDAQYFGLAQRRKRVFVVGCLGDWRSAAAVLFERHSLSGNPAPSRQNGQETATAVGGSVEGRKWPVDLPPTLNAHFGDKMGLEDQHALNGAGLFVPTYGNPGNWIGRAPENGGNATAPMDNIAPNLTSTDRHAVSYSLQGNMIGRQDHHGPQGEGVNEDVSFTLNTTDRHAVCYPLNTMTMQGRPSDDKNPRMGSGIGKNADPCPTITKAHSHAVGYKNHSGMQVRRLTPIECERLQGFPDNYTNIKENCPDGPRYKALGNSMAVPVMAWIGQRIKEVSEL